MTGPTAGPAAADRPPRFPRSPQRPASVAGQRPNLLVSEAEFQTAVIAALRLHQFTVCHFRPGRTGKDKTLTAVEGDPGCPDLIIARGGWVWLVELKTDKPTSRPSAEQHGWLTAAGPSGAVWRPADWPWIRQWLRDPFTEVW